MMQSLQLCMLNEINRSKIAQGKLRNSKVKRLGEPTKVFKTRQKTNCFYGPLKNDMFPSQGQEDITTVVKTQ
jgi:hypothetical protein